MEKEGIFRPESLERMESPEQMNAYIKTARPGIWMVLAALLVLMGAAAAWSVVGSLPETMQTKGVAVGEKEVWCYGSAEEGALDLEGCAAQIVLPDGTTVKGSVISVSDIPYSAQELADTIESDWMAENLFSQGYSYEIVIKTEESLRRDTLAAVTITTDEVRPIEFILN